MRAQRALLDVGTVARSTPGIPHQIKAAHNNTKIILRCAIIAHPSEGINHGEAGEGPH